MSAFAGFWVDGAVRKPEQRHCDSDETVIAKWKRCGDTPTEFDICRLEFSKWDSVYWLDTTPRESLTPEELWSMVKVLFPSAVSIRKVKGEEWMWNGEMELSPRIDWGNLTQYPPPVEPQWIEITRDNIGKHLFSPCRYRDSESFPWKDGCVVGWDVEDNCCFVDCDIDSPDRVMKFTFVEVQRAN